MDHSIQKNGLLKKLTISFFIIMAFFIITKAEQFLFVKSSTAMVLGLASGLSFAALLIYGRWAWTAVLLGSFLSQLFFSPFVLSSANLLLMAATAIGNTLEACVGLWLYGYSIKKQNFFLRVQHSFIFVSIGLGIALIGAVFGFIGQGFLLEISSVLYPLIFIKLWLADAVGILVLTPVLYGIYKNHHLNYSLIGLAELVSLFTLIVVFIQIVFGSYLENQLIYLLPFMVIPLLMWVAYRFSSRETTIAVLFFSVSAIFGSINGYGPFVHSNANISVLALQIYIGVISIVALVQSASIEERKNTQREAAKIGESLERRVMKRTMELATINKELLVEVNQRKKVEKALKESEDRLLFIFENANDAIFTLNQSGEFVYTSPVVTKLFGKDFKLLKAQTFLKLIDLDDREKVKKAIQDVFDNKTSQVTVGYRVEIKPEHFCWHSTSITRTETTDGRVVYIAVAKDDTERVVAEDERKKLEEQFQHSQKLESLGVLAGGIAHDFNNLLTAIMGNCGLAIMNVPDESRAMSNLNKIEKASLRAADLCQQLLAYSGKGKFIVGPLEINDIVEEMSHLLSVSISRKAKISYNFGEDLPQFNGDATQIRQIVMNIMTNASEAIANRSGKIKISTSVEYFNSEKFSSYYMAEDIPDGEYICLDVSDNGSGMDNETREKIFEPFFTTKFTGRGLGLAAVLGIVRSHHGALQITSVAGEGTTFRIVFPVNFGAKQVSTVKPTPEISWQGSGLVMVVDDEADIRDLGKETLEGAGLNVVTAEDGRDAVNIYKEHHRKIKLVLMDMTMPVLNGEETYRELCKISPNVKVILSSGYSEQEATKKFNESGLCGFLQKPYKPSDLINKVRNLIK